MNKISDILVLFSDNQAQLDKSKYETAKDKATTIHRIFSLIRPCAIVFSLLAFLATVIFLCSRTDNSDSTAVFATIAYTLVSVGILAVFIIGLWILEEFLLGKIPDIPLNVEFFEFKEKNQVIDIVIKSGEYNDDIAKVKFIYEDDEHIINDKEFRLDVKYKTDMDDNYRAILDFDIGVLFYPYEKYKAEMENEEND